MLDSMIGMLSVELDIGCGGVIIDSDNGTFWRRVKMLMRDRNCGCLEL
jgi:hypothetical protein